MNCVQCFILSANVMLDSDLAELYNIVIKLYNQTAKRNIERFSESFRFQISQEEFVNLRSQSVTLYPPLPLNLNNHKLNLCIQVFNLHINFLNPDLQFINSIVKFGNVQRIRQRLVNLLFLPDFL